MLPTHPPVIVTVPCAVVAGVPGAAFCTITCARLAHPSKTAAGIVRRGVEWA